MNNKELVQTVLDAIQDGDFETAKSLMSDDFQFSGPVPEPINREQWLGLSAKMQVAFPDLNYNFQIVRVNGDTVLSSNQLTGTHTGDFDMTAMGMGIIPASGKSFSNTKELGEATVKDGKIVSLKIQPSESAGLMAILAQIGVKVPTT
jgi:predicted ester cyclase